MSQQIDDDDDRVLRVLQTREQTRAFYDKISRAYDLLAEHSEAPVRERALEMLGCGTGEKVLEIGCGTGHSLVELARRVAPTGRVVGVDLSEGMLRQARETLYRENVAEQVDLRMADAVQLPQGRGVFDAVFMSFTLELFDTPEIPRVLAECRRVLRPDGRLGVAAMSKEGGGAIIKLYEWTHRLLPNFVDCRPIFARRSIEEAGFRVTDFATDSAWVPVEIVIAVSPG